MNIKSVTITGYKPHELNIFSEKDQKVTIIKEVIKRKIIGLLNDGLEWIVISGQQGVETWTFDVVQALKLEYDIKIAVIPPFIDQEKIWREEKQSKYHEMISAADFYQPLTNKPYEGPKQFFIKNRWLIEKTDACIILYEEEYGGSPKYFYELAMKYQEEHYYPVMIINSFDLEDFAREWQEQND